MNIVATLLACNEA